MEHYGGLRGSFIAHTVDSLEIYLIPTGTILDHFGCCWSASKGIYICNASNVPSVLYLILDVICPSFFLDKLPLLGFHA